MCCVQAACIILSGLTDTRHVTLCSVLASPVCLTWRRLCCLWRSALKCYDICHDMFVQVPAWVFATCCLQTSKRRLTDASAAPASLWSFFFCKRLTSCLLTFHINATESCKMRLWVVSCPSRCARITTRDWLKRFLQIKLGTWMIRNIIFQLKLCCNKATIVQWTIFFKIWRPFCVQLERKSLVVCRS